MPNGRFSRLSELVRQRAFLEGGGGRKPVETRLAELLSGIGGAAETAAKGFEAGEEVRTARLARKPIGERGFEIEGIPPTATLAEAKDISNIIRSQKETDFFPVSGLTPSARKRAQSALPGVQFVTGKQARIFESGARSEAAEAARKKSLDVRRKQLQETIGLRKDQLAALNDEREQKRRERLLKPFESVIADKKEVNEDKFNFAAKAIDTIVDTGILPKFMLDKARLFGIPLPKFAATIGKRKPLVEPRERKSNIDEFQRSLRKAQEAISQGAPQDAVIERLLGDFPEQERNIRSVLGQ